MWQLNNYIYKEISLNVKILCLVYSNNTSQTLLSTAQEPYCSGHQLSETQQVALTYVHKNLKVKYEKKI